jgi:hypothetical protein
VADWERKKRFLPRRACRGEKNVLARASRRICAAFSGDWESRLETVVRGTRRLAGIMLGSFSGEEVVGSESMSRDERPRCEVRDLAAERMEEGVKYARGKVWMAV